MTRGVPNKPLKPIRCPQCGREFVPHTHRTAFCNKVESDAFYAIERERGVVALKFVLSWRSGKHGRNADSAYALNQLCALADRWRAEDRAVGRDTGLLVAKKRAAGWMAVDLDSSDSPSPRVACGRDGAET